jgi:hypothetical protein
MQTGEETQGQHGRIDIESGGEAGSNDESRDVAQGEDGHAETPSRPKWNTVDAVAAMDS